MTGFFLAAIKRRDKQQAETMKPDKLTANIIDAIGVKQLAALFPVNERLVRGYRQRGQMPASWATIVRAEAEKLDPPLSVPDRCFSFKRPKGKGE